MGDLQTIAVLVIVAAAAVWVFLRARATWIAPEDSACGHGCQDCAHRSAPDPETPAASGFVSLDQLRSRPESSPR